MLRRWPSRSALRVSMLAAWMVTLHASTSAGFVGVDDGGALELVERAADLGDHRVPGDEADAGVRRVEGVGAGQVGQGAGTVAVVMPCSLDSGGSRLIGDVSRILKSNLGDMSTIPA